MFDMSNVRIFFKKKTLEKNKKLYSLFVNLVFTVQQISLVTFINTNVHTPKGGASIVWWNIYIRKEKKKNIFVGF